MSHHQTQREQDLKEDKELIQENIQNGYVVPEGSKRQRKPPQRFDEMTWVPGANNGFTAGRVCDTYDQGYRG